MLEDIGGSLYPRSHWDSPASFPGLEVTFKASWTARYSSQLSIGFRVWQIQGTTQARNSASEPQFLPLENGGGVPPSYRRNEMKSDCQVPSRGPGMCWRLSNRIKHALRPLF